MAEPRKVKGAAPIGKVEQKKSCGYVCHCCGRDLQSGDKGSDFLPINHKVPGYFHEVIDDEFEALLA